MFIVENGGAEGSQTPDLLGASEAFSQLNYRPIKLKYLFLSHRLGVISYIDPRNMADPIL